MTEELTKFKATKRKVSAWRSKLTERKGARDQLLKNKAAEEAELAQHRENERTALQASLFLQSEVAERRTKGIESMEAAATAGLRSVWGDGYRLVIETFDEQRKEGSTSVKMEFLVASPHDGEELLTGLMGERGGGLLENVGFTFRFCDLEWRGYDGPVLIDEAFKSISNDEKVHATARLIRDISDETGRQIIFATHKGAFADVADRVIKIEKVNGLAQVTVLDDSYVAPDDGGDEDGTW